MPARRAVQFVEANYLDRIEFALNDQLAQLSVQDAQDIKIQMRIHSQVLGNFIIAIDYVTTDPWPPPPAAQEGTNHVVA